MSKLVFAKQGTTSVDSTANGVVVLEVDNTQKEVQNVTSQVWYGENGDDSYIPSAGMKFKAYDYTFKLGVKKTTSSAIANKDAFITSIKDKIWDTITQNYTGIVLNKAFLSKVEDDEVEADYVIFKCTFHVTNP